MSAVAFSPDGDTIASAADDGTVRLRDAASATWRLSVRFGEPIFALAVGEGAIAIGERTGRRRDELGDGDEVRGLAPA